jgi:hypothetical protein
MKGLLMGAALLLGTSVAFGECVQVVDQEHLQQSSPNAEVTVILDGKPGLFTFEGRPVASILTDLRGKAKFSNLPAGKYSVFATLSLPLFAPALYFEVTRGSVLHPAALVMNVGDYLISRLEAAEKLRPVQKFKNFAGVIYDQANGVIPNVQVLVYRRGIWDRKTAVKVIADQRGHFSLLLEAGAYTAAFVSTGFRTEIVTFEVAPDGNREELNVTLSVAHDTCGGVAQDQGVSNYRYAET